MQRGTQSPIAQRDDWYRAATLAERAASLERSEPGATPFDEELGRSELAGWRARAPFDRGDWFAKRLELDRLSESELVRLLGESAANVRERFDAPPDWLREIDEAYAGGEPSDLDALPLAPEFRASATAGFLGLIAPLMRRGLERLRAEVRERVARRRDAPVDEQFAELAFAALPWRLHMLLHRTLVLELNVARVRGELDGETPEQRFASFVARLRRPEVAVELLAEYPVLARAAVTTIERWWRFQVEVLDHLIADWSALRATFFADANPGLVRALDSGAGDSHRGGRSVVIVGFESGARLVYKPRSLAIEAHFGELVEWVNARGSHPPLRSAVALDRGDHGWVEFVAAQPCANTDEVARFYRRQGAWLALLYALEATDIHYENLIAAGEHPVPIDLESLFHARPPEVHILRADFRMSTEATTHSVLRVGLLPNRMGAKEDQPGADISGFGGAAGQRTPDRVLQWAQRGTDAMHAVREHVAMPGAKNRPAVEGVELRALDYVDDVVAGFVDVYRLLWRERDALLAPEGPLERCAQDETRSVLRPTRAYGMLLFESTHPDLQRDARELERRLDGLWARVDDNAWLVPAIAAERADMLAGDIPLFTTRPGSRDIWTSRGERLADFWQRSGLERVRERLAGFDERDLGRQTWLVRASLATIALDSDRLTWPSYRIEPQPRPERAELRRSLIAAACEVGEELDRLALRSGEDLAWLGLTYANKRWDISPLLDDLYGGAAGVIHFLAHLGAFTGERRFLDLARRATNSLLQHVDEVPRVLPTVGAFNGLGGFVYALAQWSELLDEPSWRAHVDKLVEHLPALVDKDPDLDVVGGAAGCLLCMLAMNARGERDARAERRLDIARRCGEFLIARARPVDGGMGWFSRVETELPITGMSHGCAGIAWALSELHGATGEERCRALALAAIAYERTRFDKDADNWRDTPNATTDMRPLDERKTMSMAWCYGAPGIGLARLKTLRHIDDERLRDEVRAAVRATLSSGFGRNHCLCHGDLGNLDFLLSASEALGDERLRETVDEIGATVLHGIREHGWICGVPLGVESPALMNGLAGIGYGLLRIAAPERVPSVLALEPLPSR